MSVAFALHPIILIVDDDPQARRYLRQEVMAAGYGSLNLASGRSALQLIKSNPPDAIILDLELRDIDSKDLITKARPYFDGPIIVVSALLREIEAIDALDLGADAVVAKPLDVGEILARLRVAFRRRMIAQGIRPVVTAQGLCIDLINRIVTHRGAVVSLTDAQYAVLARLAAGAGRVILYENLVTPSTGLRTLRSTRLVVQQLRLKIELNPKFPTILITEPGIGYRLNTSRNCP